MINVESDREGHNLWCKACKGEVEWQECPDCEYGYSHHDCGEDNCACTDPEKNVECQTCRGEGGWWRCLNCEGKREIINSLLSIILLLFLVCLKFASGRYIYDQLS